MATQRRVVSFHMGNLWVLWLAWLSARSDGDAVGANHCDCGMVSWSRCLLMVMLDWEACLVPCRLAALRRPSRCEGCTWYGFGPRLKLGARQCGGKKCQHGPQKAGCHPSHLVPGVQPADPCLFATCTPTSAPTLTPMLGVLLPFCYLTRARDGNPAVQTEQAIFDPWASRRHPAILHRHYRHRRLWTSKKKDVPRAVPLAVDLILTA